jgi:hypothetical protein
MKKLGLIVFAVALCGFASPEGEPTSTDRKVHGVITSIEPAKLTIASQQHAVTGKIDPLRTKVTVHGKPAKLADLQLSSHAKAELCLDDVWLAIDTH